TFTPTMPGSRRKIKPSTSPSNSWWAAITPSTRWWSTSSTKTPSSATSPPPSTPPPPPRPRPAKNRSPLATHALAAVEAAWRCHEQSGHPLPPIEARPQATSGSDPAKSGEPLPGQPAGEIPSRRRDAGDDLRAALRQHRPRVGEDQGQPAVSYHRAGREADPQL